VNWIQTALKAGFYQAQTFCLEAMGKPPQRILMVGACRQRELARAIALQFPNVGIVAWDPDPAVAKQAEDDIHCRLQFRSGPVADLPYPDDYFDLTLLYNAPEFCPDWPAAMKALGRVTRGHLLVGVQRPWLSKLPGVGAALQAEGFAPTPQPWADRNTFLLHLNRYGKVRYQICPLPWTLYWVKMKPLRETRLRLEEPA
jgi:hypothetical protein